MTNNDKKRVLITGGYGFIGSCLIRTLLTSDNVEVANIDKLTYSSNVNSVKVSNNQKNYHFYEEDICNKEKIKQIVNSFKPNQVIHLAAETHVDRSIDGPEVFINSNVFGTYNLINNLKNYWDKLDISSKEKFKILMVSTDEVYGSLSLNENSFTEESSYLPNSPYSASKAASDHIGRAWYSTYKMPIIITNTSNNYGPWQFPEKLIPLTILKCLKKEKIPIFGNGEQVRDWIFVNDHVDGLLHTLNNGKVGEKYNIGSNNEKKNIEVVYDICNILDDLIPEEKPYSNLIEFVDDRPGHDYRYALNVNKIHKLGWKSKYNWEQGLLETINWYLSNKDFLNKQSSKFYSGERLGKL